MRTEKIERLLKSGKMTALTMAKISQAQIYKIIEKYRWADNGGKPFCPRCGNCEKIYRIKTRRQYRCKVCNYSFSPFVKTVFENHSFRGKTGLTQALYLLSLFAQNISARKAVVVSAEKQLGFFSRK